MKSSNENTNFSYELHFGSYCRKHGLDLILSFDMPPGYEYANGTFDPETKTVYMNRQLLSGSPDYEKAFFLYHELRHASQYLRPGEFSEEIRRSSGYIIMYDGTCYVRKGGEYPEFRLDGTGEYLKDLYLGQPHEVDANVFACEQAKRICGDTEGLRMLFAFWMPEHRLPGETYEAVYDLLDRKAGGAE